MDRRRVAALVPMAHVADVAAAAACYGKLGFEPCGSFAPPGDDRLSWVSPRSGGNYGDTIPDSSRQTGIVSP